MLLGNLLAAIKSEIIECSETLETLNRLDIQKLCADSRCFGQNNLFVAIRGFHSDGHRYLAQAAENGAVAAVVESVPHNCPIPYIVVYNTRRCLGLLASAFYNHPSQSLTVIGVTGTNGKTTTTNLIYHLLSKSGVRTGLIGSPYIIIGSERSMSNITTPDALDLQFIMHQIVQANCTHVVMEVSSHGIELERICGIDFDVAVITNISVDHMDLHRNQQNYIATKQRLFRRLAPESIAIYNADDPSANWIQPVTSAHTIGYGQSEKASVRARAVEFKADGSHFTLELPPRQRLDSGLFTINEERAKSIECTRQIDCMVPITGAHNISNTLAAVSTAYVLGIEPETIRQGLSTFHGVRRRLELIHQGAFTIIDDYAHNPGGIKAVLDTIDPSRFRHITLVVAIRGNRSEQINAENGQVLATYLRNCENASLIVTSSDDVVTKKDQVTPSEREAFLAAVRQQPRPVTITRTLREALEQAISQAAEGDLILLLGAQGMDAGAGIVHEVLHERAPLPI